MATLHISLSDQLKDFVRSASTQEGFSNYSDYIRSLIREERKKRKREIENSITQNMSDELIRAVQRISNFSASDERKKQMIQTYALGEVKRRNPASTESIINGRHEISTKAQERGLTSEILESIINEK